MKTIRNFINGRFVNPVSDEWLDDLEPATGQGLARVADSGTQDVAAALEAANAALPDWMLRPAADRADTLDRLAGLIRENRDALARLESDDTGKPVRLALEVDMQRAEANLRFFSGAIRHWSESAHDMGPNGFNYTLRRPLGAVACITPWNLPLYLLTWKLAPALAAGNTVVAKPSELTPLTADALAGLSVEAGLPPGVFNLVHGRGAGAGQALVDHPAIRAISFTGGTSTGRQIAAAAAPRLVRLSLELGGKNPAIVFEDANFERAIPGLVRAGFTNQGQVCLCTSRILVHQDCYEIVRERLVSAVSKLRVGDPRDPATDQGALISAAHTDKVLGYLDQARADGAQVLCGGEPVLPAGRCSKGWFVQPAVIEDLPAGSSLLSEEIFGPIVTLERFTDEEDAVRCANSTQYGLAASIWTGNVNRAHRMAAAVDAGIIWVNSWMVRDLRTPFGGMKASGVGREGGFHSLEFFTEARNVCISHE